ETCGEQKRYTEIPRTAYRPRPRTTKEHHPLARADRPGAGVTVLKCPAVFDPTPGERPEGKDAGLLRQLKALPYHHDAFAGKSSSADTPISAMPMSSTEWVSANTSRTENCVHADICQYIPNRSISPGSHGWAADSPLRGSVADWSGPCAAG